MPLGIVWHPIKCLVSPCNYANNPNNPTYLDKPNNPAYPDKPNNADNPNPNYPDMIILLILITLTHQLI